MQTILHTVLTSLLDYAGLFPPASLPLEAVLQNYSVYLRGEDAASLGRLIIPISQFSQAEALGGALPQGRTPVSALFPRTGDVQEFRAKAEILFAEVARCRRESEVLAPQIIEMPLPDDVGEDASETELGAFLWMLSGAMEAHGLDIPVFLEPPMRGAFVMRSDSLLSVYAAHNESGQSPHLGLKVRCGGTQPQAFPTSETLARYLVAAAKRGVPVKATAGLHHPWPHFDEAIGTRMHGFLNVMTATAMAMQHPNDRTCVEAVLNTEDATKLTLTSDGLQWGDVLLEAEELQKLRENGFLSFGTCSFTEPLDYLKERYPELFLHAKES